MGSTRVLSGQGLGARSAIWAGLVGLLLCGVCTTGMAQTGVPFGEVAAVRDWLQISAPVTRPQNEHPKRPVQGFDCPRSEELRIE